MADSITIRFGVESTTVAIEDGKTVRQHITTRVSQFLGLPESYQILADGSPVGDNEEPVEGEEYTVEAAAPKKAAKCGSAASSGKTGKKAKPAVKASKPAKPKAK